MPRIRPFEPTDLAAAGRLLAQRHAAHRIAQPLLSKRYEDSVAAEASIAGLLRAEGASGAVALDGGRLTGFLLGAPEPGTFWGPNIWVDAAGHAAEDPETLRDLYGFAAAEWVAAGRTAHYALVPASDHGLVDAWFRLGFGRQQTHGIRDVRLTAAPSPQVRRARRTDIDALARIELTLPQHQRGSPVFSAYTGPNLEWITAEWERDIDDPGYTTFVLERDGRVVGSAVGTPMTNSSLPHQGPVQPDNAAYLGFAAVLPQARGQGAGRALGEAVIRWAGAAGFGCVVIDWRSTNLLSSRAWPRLGFTEYFLRLHRLVGY